MKKIISVILTVAIAMSLFPIAALAEGDFSLFALMSTVASGTLPSGLSWRLDDDNTLYFEGTEAIVSNDWGDYGEYIQNVETVMIDNSITEIATGAFSGFSSLKNITLGSNIKNIRPNAFNNTAYYNDTNNWIDGVLTLDDWLIEARPEELNEEYIIDDNITCIADYAFKDCNNLTTITIAENVKNIGWGAFENCTGVKRVYFNAINYTREGGSDSLFPTTEKLIIGDKVTKIPDYTFYGAKSLKRVSFPQTLKEIGAYAFYDTGLKQIDIPERTTSIGVAAFAHCSELENIFVDSKNQRYCSDDGVLLNNYRNRLHTIPGRKRSTLYPTLLNISKNMLVRAM